MLNIAMVQVGDFCSRGSEYVAKLTTGIRRNMPKGVEYRMSCITDGSSGLPLEVIAKSVPAGVMGWWAKLALFKPSMFPVGERVLFFDLDTIITGDLTDIASYGGVLAGLQDFFYPEHFGSACMAWGAGALDHIWTTWHDCGRPAFDKRGDQFWIETMMKDAKVDYWQDILPGQFVSFKADCWLQGKIPEGARVLGFHGRPRPHECRAGFVERLWKQERAPLAA